MQTQSPVHVFVFFSFIKSKWSWSWMMMIFLNFCLIFLLYSNHKLFKQFCNSWNVIICLFFCWSKTYVICLVTWILYSIQTVSFKSFQIPCRFCKYIQYIPSINKRSYKKNLNLRIQERIYWEILQVSPFSIDRIHAVEMHWMNKFWSLPEILEKICLNLIEANSQHDAVTANSVKQILTRTSLTQKLWKFDFDVSLMT